MRTVFQPDGATTGQDTWLQEDDAATTKGANVHVRNSFIVNTRRNGMYRVDLSSLTGRTAISGYLELTSVTSPIGPRNFAMYAVSVENAGWVPATATWNTRDGTNAWHGGTGTSAGCSIAGQDYDNEAIHSWTVATSTPANTKFIIPIPAEVLQIWMDTPEDNAGLLQLTSDATDFGWHSSNSATPSFRPRWVVHYEPGIADIIPSGATATFDGAVGYGRFACLGHETWPVIYVTNLNNSGAGSLRVALGTDGPRVICFKVGGTITIDSQLLVTKPYCVIAGQTAPGGGICIKSGVLNMDAALSIRTHNVIVSCIRSRPGIGGTSLTAGARHGDAVDSIGNTPSGTDVHDVYLYCCSLSWSVDECMGFESGSYARITADRCITSEPLNQATHSYTVADPNVGHAKCLIFSSLDSQPCTDITVYRCIMWSAIDRMPMLRLSGGTSDQINCVIGNWGLDNPSEDGWPWVSLYSDKEGDITANIVGNYYKAGTNSATSRKRVYYNHPIPTVGDTMTVFYSGNFDVTLAGSPPLFHQDPANSTLTLAGALLGDAAFPTPLTAAQAFTALVTNGECGAYYRLDENGARVANRDTVDTRILAEIAAGTGTIIDSRVAGDWPTLAAGTAYTDTDADGIPDAYETAHPTHTLRDFLWG